MTLGIGTLLDVVALAFAAQSLIAPLAGLTLVFNILIAPCFLKEQATPATNYSQSDDWMHLDQQVGYLGNSCDHRWVYHSSGVR